jgi:hypothetical protein
MTVHKHIAMTDAQAVLENILEVVPACSSEAHMLAVIMLLLRLAKNDICLQVTLNHQVASAPSLL